MSIFSPQEWFETPLGQYVRDWEVTHVARVVSDIFGYHAVQLGLPGVDLLSANRMPQRWLCVPHAAGAVQAQPDALPFDSNSLDLVVLPHVLEFSDVPHQVLREVERVLVPEGHLVLTGFNPASLWGVRRFFSGRQAAYPWCGHYLALPRIKDWMQLLGFETQAGAFGCYAPAFQNPRIRARWRFMDDAGDRWWPVCGGVYMLQAIKRVKGMRLIMPNWQTRRVGASQPLASIPPRRDIAQEQKL